MKTESFISKRGFSRYLFSTVASCVVTGSFIASICSQQAYALPSGYQSVTGDANFVLNGNTLTVTTQNMRSIAQYQQFNIGANEAIHFQLPSAQASILNRVVGGSASQIMGQMQSNGQVFLVNTSGIVFGATSQVNVGSLTASTLNITDSNFLNGHYQFTQSGTPAAIEHQGTITVPDGGYVVLAGGAINVPGNITAPHGQVHLAVGQQVTMTLDNNLSASVTVDQPLQQSVNGYNTAINVGGLIEADGGLITLQASLANAIYQHAINLDGYLVAEGLGTKTGEIYVSASNGLDEDVVISGALDAAGAHGSDSPFGGKITVLGDKIVVNTNAGIIADSMNNGNAGSILLHSTQETDIMYHGWITAAADESYGNGGTIQIYSDKAVNVNPNAIIDVYATQFYWLGQLVKQGEYGTIDIRVLGANLPAVVPPITNNLANAPITLSAQSGSANTVSAMLASNPGIQNTLQGGVNNNNNADLSSKRVDFINTNASDGGLAGAPKASIDTSSLSLSGNGSSAGNDKKANGPGENKKQDASTSLPPTKAGFSLQPDGTLAVGSPVSR